MSAPVNRMRRLAAAYASGSIGTGVFSTVPSVLLLYFSTEMLGIAPGVAAAIILVPKFWSIVWDPWVGRASDRLRTRWGRRAPFMIAGAVGMALAFMALFSPPALSPAGLTAWVAVAYFGLVCLYSLYAVPYMAVPAETQGGPDAGARLVAWRMTFVMGGVILGGAVAPMVVSALGGGRGGYAGMAALLAVVCCVAMLIPTTALRARPAPPVAAKGGRWAEILAQPAYLALAIAYLLQMAAAAVVSAALPYVVARVFHRAESDVGLAMLVLLSVTLAAAPLWAVIGRRDPFKALAWATGVYAVGAAASPVLAHLGGSWSVFVASLAVLGLGFAGLQVLPFTLAAQLVGAATAEAEGLLTGVWAAAEKIGLAVGAALLGVVLARIPAHGREQLLAFSGVAPVVLALASLAPLAVSYRGARA